MKKIEHNTETGEVIERDMTPEELQQLKADQAEIQARMDAENAEKARKSAILERLGITNDEVTLLLS